jgi:hypothetical protein
LDFVSSFLGEWLRTIHDDGDTIEQVSRCANAAAIGVEEYLKHYGARVLANKKVAGFP